jgi:Tfp pilus assembly protein PilO
VKSGPNPTLFMALSGVMLLIGGGACYMQYSKLGDHTRQVAALRQDVRDESEVARDLELSREALETTAKELSHLEGSIAEIEYIPTMLKELEQTGLEYGTEVTGIRPIAKQVSKQSSKQNAEVKESRKPYEELNIEVKGRGSYGAVMRFTKGLQSFPKIVAVRTVSLTPKTDTTGSTQGNLEVTVELRAYAFPPKTLPRMTNTAFAPPPVPPPAPEQDSQAPVGTPEVVNHEG